MHKITEIKSNYFRKLAEIFKKITKTKSRLIKLAKNNKPRSKVKIFKVRIKVPKNR